MRNHFHPYPYAERNKNTPGNRALDQETQHSSPVDQTAARSAEGAAHSLERSHPPCLATPTARQPPHLQSLPIGKRQEASSPLFFLPRSPMFQDRLFAPATLPSV
jgi:hypothetical protein